MADETPYDELGYSDLLPSASEFSNELLQQVVQGAGTTIADKYLGQLLLNLAKRPGKIILKKSINPYVGAAVDVGQTAKSIYDTHKAVNEADKSFQPLAEKELEVGKKRAEQLRKKAQEQMISPREYAKQNPQAASYPFNTQTAFQPALRGPVPQLRNPLDPKFQEQDLNRQILGSMQEFNNALAQDTYLPPERQAEFDSAIQGYRIPDIQLPNFNQ